MRLCVKIYFVLTSALFSCAPRQLDREPREIPERISKKLFAWFAHFAVKIYFAVAALSKLPLMLPFRVQDAEDNDTVAFDAVEKFVGKTAREQPAKVAVIKRPSIGVVRQ